MKKLLIIALSLLGSTAVKAQTVTNSTGETIYVTLTSSCGTGSATSFTMAPAAGITNLFPPPIFFAPSIPTVEPVTTWTNVVGTSINNVWTFRFGTTTLLGHTCSSPISYSSNPIALVTNTCVYSQNTTIPNGSACTSPDDIPFEVVYVSIDPSGNVNITY